MILDYDVTQDDIDNGEQHFKGGCAQQLSAFRQLAPKGFGFISVDQHEIRIADLQPVVHNGKRYRKWFIWPQPYPNWIKNWDEDRTSVDPITVRLDTDFADVEYALMKPSGSNTSRNRKDREPSQQAGQRKKRR